MGRRSRKTNYLMKARWPTPVGFVIAIVALATLIAVALRTREPVYQGKPLRDWVERLNRPDDAQAAQTALREIGPRAIPFLLARVRHERSVLQRCWRATHPQLPSIIQRRLPAPRLQTMGELNSCTLHSIHMIGPSAVPWLMTALRDKDVMIAELENTTDEQTWRRLLPMLGNAGELAKAAVPAISARLSELEKTGPPLGDEDLLPLTREVLCQIDPEAAERLNSPSE